MTPHAWSLTFGLTALLAAVVVAVWCTCAHLAEIRAEDATYPTLVPVDRELWAPDAPLWEHSATPIYDQLAAENLRAELDDEDALYRWMEATQ